MKNLKQKLCIKLQIDSETNEPVLFKKFINNTSIDKNGNKIEEGVTIILIQTVSDTFARNRVREQVRVTPIIIDSLELREVKWGLREMLADTSYVDDPDKVIDAYEDGTEILLKDDIGGYLFLQEFAVPLIPLEKGNTKAFLSAVNASLNKHSKSEPFRIYFEKVLRNALHNIFKGQTSMFQKIMSALENDETLLFDFNNVFKLEPRTQQAIAKEVHYAFFEKKYSKLRRGDNERDFCRVGSDFIFRFTFFTNNPIHLEEEEDIFVKHDNQIFLPKGIRAIHSLDQEDEVEDEEENEEDDEEEEMENKCFKYEWSTDRYLTIPISAMQSMPYDWQQQMDALLNEMGFYID